MSKYDLLWQRVAELLNQENVTKAVLSFEEIKDCIGFEIDHSFLKYKKELETVGCKVSKISMKDKKITFERA